MSSELYMEFYEQWLEDNSEPPTYEDYQDWLGEKADLAFGGL